MTFDLHDNGNHYAPAVFRSDDYYNEVAFSRSTGTPFKNREIKWDLSQGGIDLKDSATTTKTIPFPEELNQEAIPYIELNEENGLVNSINVRFVSKNNTNNAVTLDYDLRADVFFDYTYEENDENGNVYWPENNLEISAGQEVQEIIYLNNPIAAERIRCVYVHFNRDDERNTYQWLFENPAPIIDKDQYVDDVWYGAGNGSHYWGIQHSAADESKYPITWTITNGTLPKGLELLEEGAIAGIAEEIGSFTFTVEARNQFGSSTAEFTIRVLAPSSLELSAYSNINSFFIKEKSSYKSIYNEAYVDNNYDFFLNKNYEENLDNSTRLKSSSKIKTRNKPAIKKQAEYLSKLNSQRFLAKQIMAWKKSGHSANVTKSLRDKVKSLSTSSSSTRIENAFTIGGGSGTYYYYADENFIVSEDEPTTFDLYDDGWSYLPVKFFDENGYENIFGINFYSDEADVFNNRVISWEFPDELSYLNGETTLDNFSQFDDDIVPYIEFKEDKNGNIQNVTVRLVKKSNVNEPITVDSDMYLGINCNLYDWSEGEFYIENNIPLNSGDTAQGETSFNRAVQLSNIRNIGVYYSRNGTNFYHWFFNNPVPHIITENEGQNFGTVYVGEEYWRGVWLSGGLIGSTTKWTISKGKLPTGLSLETDESGHPYIYGTPTKDGRYPFRIKAQNSYGSHEAEFTIIVKNLNSELKIGHGLYSFFSPNNNGALTYDEVLFNGLTFWLGKSYPSDENYTAKKLQNLSSVMSGSTAKKAFSKIFNSKPLSPYSKLAQTSKTLANKKLKTKPITLTAKSSNVNRVKAPSNSRRIDNAFTIEAGNAYTYQPDRLERQEVAANKIQTFSLFGDEYNDYAPVVFVGKGDGDPRNLRFYGINEDDDVKAFQNRKISWNLDKIKRGLGSVTLDNLRLTSEVLDDVVPYFEFGEEDNDGVKAINWRLVKKSNTDEPVTLDFDTTVSMFVNHKRSDVYTPEPENNYQYIEAGSAAEGTMYITNNPIQRENIGMISIHFEKDGIGYDWFVANAAPNILNNELPMGTAGEVYYAGLDIAGAGLNDCYVDYSDTPFDISADTGGIYCEPTVNDAGEYTIKIVAKNDEGSDEREYTLRINPAPDLKPVIDIKTIGTGKVVEDYYQKFPLKEYTPVTWDITGLPDNLGLEFDKEQGVLSGTPKRVWQGKITIIAKNQAKGSAKQQFTLRIEGEAPSIDLGDLSEKTALITDKISYNYTVNLNGSFGTTFKYSGKQPTGMTITPISEDGEIRAFELSGTPTKKGNYTLKFNATNVLKESDSTSVTFNVSETLGISANEKLANGTFGKKYSFTFKYKGGSSKNNLTWEIVSGDIPEGMTLVNGKLSGTPKSIGSHDFTVQLSDSGIAGEYGSVSKDFTLYVKGVAPKIKTSSLTADLNKYVENSLKLLTSAGSEPLSWDIVTENLGKGISADLPAGLTLNSDGTITGTPEQDFKGKVRFRVQNTEGFATKDISLTIKGKKPVINNKNTNIKIVEGEECDVVSLDVSGSPKLVFDWDGKKPDWLYMVSDDSGIVTIKADGTQSANNQKAVTVSVKIKVSNYTGKATKTFKITVEPAKDTAKSKSLSENDSDSNNNSDNEEFEELEEFETDLNELSADIQTQSDSKDLTTEYDSEPEVLLTGGNAFDVGEVVSVNGIDYLVVASLPEMKVAEGAQYDFELTLDENAQVGKDLFWFANPDNSEISEDDEIIEFADETGKEIKTVPENRIVIISAWFNKDVIYKPVIAVKLDN